jgi:hypothetical protein
MRPFKTAEIWGNGAIILEPIHPDGVIPLNPGTTLVHGHKTYHLSTPAYYRAEYGEVMKKEDNTPYIFGLGSIICAGEHPDKGKEMIRVEYGMLVLTDGALYTIEKDENQNLQMVPAETPSHHMPA